MCLDSEPDMHVQEKIKVASAAAVYNRLGFYAEIQIIFGTVYVHNSQMDRNNGSLVTHLFMLSVLLLRQILFYFYAHFTVGSR